MPAWIFSGVLSLLPQCSLNYTAVRRKHVRSVCKCVCPVSDRRVLPVDHVISSITPAGLAQGVLDGVMELQRMSLCRRITPIYNLFRRFKYKSIRSPVPCSSSFQHGCLIVFDDAWYLSWLTFIWNTQSKKACGAAALHVCSRSEFSCHCLLEWGSPGLSATAAMFLIHFSSQFSFSASGHFTDVLLLRRRRFMIRSGSIWLRTTAANKQIRLKLRCRRPSPSGQWCQAGSERPTSSVWCWSQELIFQYFSIMSWAIV